jgi:hypothetical protein
MTVVQPSAPTAGKCESMRCSVPSVAIPLQGQALRSAAGPRARSPQCTLRSGLIRQLNEKTERSCATMKKTPSLDIRTLRRAVQALGVTLCWQGSQWISYGREIEPPATRSRQNAMRLNSYWTDENDLDEILTQGGLPTEVIEQGLPFALSSCGFAQIGWQRLWG